MARWLIHGTAIGASLLAIALGLHDRAPRDHDGADVTAGTDPYSLAWTTPLQQMRPTVWGVWHPDAVTITELPAALQGVRAVALALQQGSPCSLHVRLLCLDETAATLATEAVEGLMAIALLEHRYIPWLTPSLRSISVHRTAHLIDLTMLCTAPQLKQLLRELRIL